MAFKKIVNTYNHPGIVGGPRTRHVLYNYVIAQVLWASVAVSEWPELQVRSSSVSHDTDEQCSLSQYHVHQAICSPTAYPSHFCCSFWFLPDFATCTTLRDPDNSVEKTLISL